MRTRVVRGVGPAVMATHESTNHVDSLRRIFITIVFHDGLLVLA